MKWISFPPLCRPGPHYRGFTVTLIHTTLRRTPLEEWSAGRRDLYLTTYNTHNRQTAMPPAGFEHAIPASRRRQTPHLRPRGHWSMKCSYVKLYYALELCCFVCNDTCSLTHHLTLSWPGDVRVTYLLFCVILTNIGMLEISLKIRNIEFQQSPTGRFALLHAVRRIRRTWYSQLLCAIACSANCYWQLFALAHYKVSDVVLIFRLHICQADFTDTVA